MKASALFLFLFVAMFSNAQFCGQSDSTVCSPSYFAADTGKLSDLEDFDSLPCIVRGVPYNETITFRTDSFCLVFGQQFGCLYIYYVRLDSLWDLPGGLCWATNKPTNKATTGEWLCLNFSGTTNVPAGIYKAQLKWNIHHNAPDIDEPDPKPIYLRVIEPNTPCLPHSMLGIEDSKEALPKVYLRENTLHVNPSPYPFTVTVSDLLGRVVKQDFVSAGEELQMDVSDVNGLFLVTVRNNNSTSTSKFYR